MQQAAGPEQHSELRVPPGARSEEGEGSETEKKAEAEKVRDDVCPKCKQATVVAFPVNAPYPEILWCFWCDKILARQERLA